MGFSSEELANDPAPAGQWVRSPILQKATGWSERTILRKAQYGDLKWRWNHKRLRNGKREREYSSLLLSPEQQLKLAALVSSAPDQKAPTNQLALGLASCSQPPAPSHIAPQNQALVERRVNLIQPMIDFHKGRLAPQRLEDGRELRTLDDVAEWIASQHPDYYPAERKNGQPRQKPRALDKSTVWRLYRRYQKLGCVGLTSRPRADRAKSRFFVKHAAAALFIQHKYLNERLSVQLAHEALVREWSRVNRNDSRPPSYSTVLHYLNSLPRGPVVLAREGEKQFNDRFASYTIRGPVPVMGVWVSDHAKHDVWVRNDLWPDVPWDQALRPWLTAISDMGSRKIVGAVWCATPSSRSISSALRMAISSYGIPESFYIDNGKDYEKIGRVDLAPEAQGVLQRLGVRVTYCLPRHPQSKPIESWFATVRKRFDVLWGDFYCASSPALRPEACDVALKDHGRFLDGKCESSPLPLASEFVHLAAAWIGKYNAEHHHSGRGMNGRSPDQVFDEAFPLEKRQALLASVNPRTLDILLWDRIRRKVSEGGCVQIDGARYEPADSASLGPLFAWIEREVLVARDPYNVGEAIALDTDTGIFIGVLRAQKLLEQGPTSHDEIRAMSRVRRTMRKQVRGYCAALAAATDAAGLPSELEALRRRTAAKAGTGDIARLAPGVRKPALPEPAARAPRIGFVFVSDAVAANGDIFDDIEYEDEEICSPFVDDAVKKLVKAWREPDSGKKGG